MMWTWTKVFRLVSRMCIIEPGADIGPGTHWETIRWFRGSDGRWWHHLLKLAATKCLIDKTWLSFRFQTSQEMGASEAPFAIDVLSCGDENRCKEKWQTCFFLSVLRWSTPVRILFAADKENSGVSVAVDINLPVDLTQFPRLVVSRGSAPWFCVGFIVCMYQTVTRETWKLMCIT